LPATQVRKVGHGQQLSFFFFSFYPVSSFYFFFSLRFGLPFFICFFFEFGCSDGGSRETAREDRPGLLGSSTAAAVW
jgi:hypothetical protein